MPRPYHELRNAMDYHGVDQAGIAQWISRSRQYVCNCLCCRADWLHEEQYIILARLGLPPEEVYKYFPPRGGVGK